MADCSRQPRKSALKPTRAAEAARVDTKRKEEIEQSVRKRFDAEKRAHETLLALIDGPVSTEVLQSAARFIDAACYADVIAERVISKLCGYPLCSRDVEPKPHQKYHISTETNQVFDITDRKNFCSGACYAASLVYEKQLSETPVWLRDGEVLEEVKVLAPGEIRGAQGVAVPLTDENTQLIKEMIALNLETDSSTESSRVKAVD